ncbi:hypothetical protein TrispH2_006491 [Trichoplax sp. H2]|nr:hypothetical protein TrispH2_006491 [Trichoplax sp. H2]|eukprot:RDD41306.1 hypothetical protein TrispH2_006491 [Trichoplax sp. H2]
MSATGDQQDEILQLATQLKNIGDEMNTNFNRKYTISSINEIFLAFTNYAFKVSDVYSPSIIIFTSCNLYSAYFDFFIRSIIMSIL